jgi:outer membrane protein assembly factor BamB
VNGFSNVSKIDLLSGKMVKQITSVVSIPSKIVALDGTLYLVRSNALIAIDMKKMKPKWEWKNPASGSCYNCSFELSSPVIDETIKSLFITDGRELYCIKLPE